MALRVEGKTVEEIFENAVMGIVEMSAVKVSKRQRAEKIIEKRAPSTEALLIRTINETIFLIEVEGMVPEGAEAFLDIKEEEKIARMRLLCRKIKKGRGGFAIKVKAATYSNLRIERGREGWTARIVVDI